MSKKRISTQDADAARSRLKGVEGDGTTGSGLGSDTELVIEVSCHFPYDPSTWLTMQAIPEIPDLKLGLFKRLGAALPASTILGSNTSSISLTRIAAAAASGRGGPTDPEAMDSAARVVGIHFFNPVPQM